MGAHQSKPAPSFLREIARQWAYTNAARDRFGALEIREISLLLSDHYDFINSMSRKTKFRRKRQAYQDSLKNYRNKLDMLVATVRRVNHRLVAGACDSDDRECTPYTSHRTVGFNVAEVVAGLVIVLDDMRIAFNKNKQQIASGKRPTEIESCTVELEGLLAKMQEIVRSVTAHRSTPSVTTPPTASASPTVTVG
jgi:hypothetical protein